MVRNIFALPLAASMALTLAGCASNPEDISAAYVSDNQYSGYSCSQLGDEATALSNRATALELSLKKRRQNDAAAVAIGVIVFLPIALLAKGDGPEANEYADIKGQLRTIDQVQKAKKCGLNIIHPK